MSTDVSRFTEEQKQQYRQYFAALREHNLREREWKRQETVDPERCREAYDNLWIMVREVHPRHQGDAPADDEAEERVARAVAGVCAGRSHRSIT